MCCVYLILTWFVLMRFANLFDFWFDEGQRQVTIWQVIFRNFVASVTKSLILIIINNISSFVKSGNKYLWQGKISACTVLLSIKVVPVKNDHFLHPKFELHRYQQMNGFLYWRGFYGKKYGAYTSHKLIVRLIPTWFDTIYDLLTVSQIWSSNQQLSSFKYVSSK